jgi:hypothetical protein
VTALTSAALTASRALLAISARSLASAEERATLPQFCLLVLVAVAAAGARDQGRAAKPMAAAASVAVRVTTVTAARKTR